MSVLQEFETARDGEYSRQRAALHPVKISRHNPRLTQRWDHDQRAEVDRHMREWCRHWWQQHGYVLLELGEGAFRVDEIAN